jgi:hypothetical protein
LPQEKYGAYYENYSGKINNAASGPVVFNRQANKTGDDRKEDSQSHQSANHWLLPPDIPLAIVNQCYR